jgi:hypothetical protein
MTSLTHLQLSNAPFLRALAMEQLTQLTQLEALDLEGVCANRQLSVVLRNEVRDSSDG